MGDKYTIYAESVGRMGKQKQLRKLKAMTPISGAFILFEDKKLLSFCSHDYLGLADNSDIKKSAVRALLQHGITASSEAQDLYLCCQQELENKLSAMCQREAALLFPTRFDANAITLATLAHEQATLFLDEGAHPSLHQGAQGSGARVITYPHNRLDLLEPLLKEAKTPTKIIATESIFSYSGEVSNLPTLITLGNRHDALLYVDDSHAFGISGIEGAGLCPHFREIDLISGSFSKACGAYGGYIATSPMLRDYLLSLSPIKTPYLFPPPIIGAIDAALDLIPQLEGERKQLEQRAHWLRHSLASLGFKMGKHNTPLISLTFNALEEAESLRGHLKEEQILIGPPHLFPNQARINLALNVCHMPDHLTRLIEGIKGWQAATIY